MHAAVTLLLAASLGLATTTTDYDDYRLLDDQTTCRYGIGRTYSLPAREAANTDSARLAFLNKYGACFSILGDAVVIAACTPELDLPAAVAESFDLDGSAWMMCRVSLTPLDVKDTLTARAENFILLNNATGDGAKLDLAVTEALNPGKRVVDGWELHNGQTATLDLAFDLQPGQGSAANKPVLGSVATADVLIVDERVPLDDLIPDFERLLTDQTENETGR